MQRTVKMYISGIETFVSVKKLWQTIDSEIMIISFVFLPDFNPKITTLKDALPIARFTIEDQSN